MMTRVLIAAAALALTAGCNARKQTTHNRAESQKQEKAETATDDHETAGDYAGEPGEKVAEATRDAAEATVAEGKRVDDNAKEVGKDAAEVTRDAADDTLRETDRAQEKVLGSKETASPERGVDIAKNNEETPNPDENVIADKPAAAIGTEVTASIGSIDRKKKRITFRIDENVDEISLQSGKEITVPFMDLQLLTGMSKERAIEALQEAGDVKVRVFGKGESMRIVEIDLDKK